LHEKVFNARKDIIATRNHLFDIERLHGLFCCAFERRVWFHCDLVAQDEAQGWGGAQH
jgi:hypothetical protein